MISRKVARYLLFIFTLAIGAIASPTIFAEWNIQPIVQTKLTYLDNISLDSEDEDSGFVGEIDPGVTIDKLTGRLQVRLDYLMQNFYYFDEDEHSSDHNLDAIARYAVIPNKVFLNSFARATQVLVDNDQQLEVDNISDTGNTTDEYSYGIGPQLVQDIGGVAIADIQYLYAEQRFDDETADDVTQDGDLDDNNRQLFTASLANPKQESSRLDWTASHEYEKVNFDTGDTFKFVTSQIDVGYQILPRLEILGSYGYEENDLGSDNVLFDDEDGTIWSAGLLAGIGQFTTLEIRRAERFFDDFWLGSLTVAGQKLAVTGRYEERTALSGIEDDIEFEFNQVENLLDQVDVLNNEVDISVDDANSVSVSKVWEIEIAYSISKSTFLAQFENEDEEFIDTTNREKFEEYTIGWIWQITGISSLSTIAEFIKNESVGVGTQNESDLFEIEVVYTKALSPKTDLGISYEYAKGDSDDLDAANLDDDGDFTANTISIGLVHRF